jgi:hypothetical protein
MGRNKLFGIRLPQDYINALEYRHPGKPIVEAIRLTLGESLGLLQSPQSPQSPQSIPSQTLDVIGTVNELLADIYKRIAVLEAIQVNPDNQEDANPVNPDNQEIEVNPDNQVNQTNQEDVNPDNQVNQDNQEIEVNPDNQANPDNQEVEAKPDNQVNPDNQEVEAKPDNQVNPDNQEVEAKPDNQVNPDNQEDAKPDNQVNPDNQEDAKPDNQANQDKPPVEDVIRTLKLEGKTRVIIRDEINKRGYRLDNGNKFRNEEVREILSQLGLT